MALDAAAAHVSLDTAAQFWTDTSNEATPDQLAWDPAVPWRATKAGTVYPLRTGQALWLRFWVTPDGTGLGRWFLEVPYPSVNRVTLFTADPGGSWVAQAAGDTLPVASWPVPHRHPLLPLALVANGEPQQFLLRVENPHTFSAPLAIVSEAALFPAEQRISLILGIYFGLAGLVVVLALFDAVSLRDPAFAWYALAVIVMGLAQGSMIGSERPAPLACARLVERRGGSGPAGGRRRLPGVVPGGAGFAAAALTPAVLGRAGGCSAVAAGLRRDHAG